MIITISERMQRLQRLDNELLHQVKNWRYYPVVKAIQAMRGLRLLCCSRHHCRARRPTSLDHPRKLMAYVGLVPTESSSGGKTKRGSLTKCGNSRARRLLIEGAHTHKHKANMSQSNCNCDKKDCPKKLSILLGMLSNDYVAAINDYYKKANIETLSSPLSQEK
ncbi:transposase [Vibrio lentus]|uniref:transposase n=1 Tax=Vibrio lentus TaxID=136468 RepID=UPI0039A490AF